MIVPAPHDARIRRVVRWLLPLILVSGILANIAWTVRGLEPSGSVFIFAESPDLADLVAASRPTTRAWYHFYADIGKLAHGETLTIPESVPMDVNLAAALSDVEVRKEQYDARVAEESFDLPKRGGQWLLGGQLERYVIFEGDPGSDYWLGFDGKLIVVVPVSDRPVPEPADG